MGKAISDNQTIKILQSKVANLTSFLFQGLVNGYLTFVISILFIGACTAVIGDIAGHLGCLHIGPIRGDPIFPCRSSFAVSLSDLPGH